MSFTGKYIIDWVSKTLHDTKNTRWPRADMLAYLNLAQVQVVTVQPQANAKYRTIKLAVGSLQKVGNDDIQLLTITRNMGADGLTPGPAVGMTDRPTLDSHMATWTKASGASSTVESYVYDERVQTQFYVYPPVPTTVDVWVEYISAQRPTDLTQETDILQLPDVFVVPVMRWMIYLCLSFQMDNAYSANAALHHYQLFNTELGQQLNAYNLVNPSLMETYLSGQQGKANG